MRYLLWNCRHVIVNGPHWWVNIGSGNGLVSSDTKRLPEAMLTQIYVDIWRHQATVSKEKSLQLIWWPGSGKFHLWVLHLQTGFGDLTAAHEKVIAPAMTWVIYTITNAKSLPVYDFPCFVRIKKSNILCDDSLKKLFPHAYCHSLPHRW